jgi:hypothetical protein
VRATRARRYAARTGIHADSAGAGLPVLRASKIWSIISVKIAAVRAYSYVCYAVNAADWKQACSDLVLQL